MKVEYYAYYPVLKSGKFRPHGNRRHVGVAEIRKRLPERIASELMEGNVWQTGNSIWVETKKNDVVAYLNKVMKLSRNNFSKRRQIEITEDEIDNYDYFFIDVRTMEWKKQIDYEITRPTCKYEPCPWGAKRTSPTRIYSRRIRDVNIGRIWDIWSLETRFVISEKLKRAFDDEGITGLEYEPCLVEHERHSGAGVVMYKDGLYVAQIIPGIAQRAKKIYLHDYCKEHRVILRFAICDVFTRPSEVLPYDFQMINRVIVNNRQYIYRTPRWFVSRRVLKILLEHARHDMRPRGAYLGRTFVPVVIETSPETDRCSRAGTGRISRGVPIGTQ